MISVTLFSGYFINRKELCGELALGELNEKEILSAGFGKFGTAFFCRLNGLFSFVLYDDGNDRWYCCRDRFGGRGLYYSYSGKGTPVFSENIKDLLRQMQQPAAFREELLEVYLSYSYIPGEDTAFVGIYKPLPGFFYCFEGGKISKKRFFTPEFQSKKRTRAEWEALLSDTLDSVLEGKEKEGTSLLSSGVDSSYLCKRLYVKDTYTASYANADYSEAGFAESFSGKIGARHHTLPISPEEYLSSVPETMRALEQPSGDASAEVLLMACRGIKEEADRCYSGEGIDELFLGYYMNDVRSISAKQTLMEAEYIGTTYALTEKEKKRFLKNYSPSRKMEYVQEAYTLSRQENNLRQAAMVDLLVWMNGNLLPNLYALGDAADLSIQTPYLDNRLYDLALQIPSRLQNDAFQTKKLFRKAAGRLLDRESAMRKKRGFPVPVRLWIRRPDYVQKIRQAFTSDTAFRFFNREELTAFYDEMLADPADRNSWQIIWCIYCFIVWYDEMINPYFPVQRWQVYDERFNREEAWSKAGYPGCDWCYMKQAGCLVTSLASLLVLHGLADADENIFNPVVFNEKIKSAKLLDENADLLEDRLDTIYPVHYIGEVDWDIGTLKKALQDGLLCLLRVPGVHGAYHFVVPTEIVNGDVRILDSGWDHEFLSEFTRCYSILLYKRME